MFSYVGFPLWHIPTPNSITYSGKITNNNKNIYTNAKTLLLIDFLKKKHRMYNIQFWINTGWTSRVMWHGVNYSHIIYMEQDPCSVGPKADTTLGVIFKKNFTEFYKAREVWTKYEQVSWYWNQCIIHLLWCEFISSYM